MHKYIIMGAQGSGKGTQAILLKERYDLVHISVGDIFRWNIQTHTKLGARIKRIMEEGQLVGDEIVEEIVQRRLQEHDWNYGFILDGFPRNRPQAQFFLESYDIDAVIHIRVSDEAVIQRMLARRKCASCGLDYNLIGHRPKQMGVCDVCGGTLEQRADDNESAILNRLQDYHQKTVPILDLFRRKELVIEVEGTGTPDEIQKEIRERLGLTQTRLQRSPVGAA